MRKKERQKKKQARQCEEPIIYSMWVFVKKAYFWIIAALQASNWSQITPCILTNVLNSISVRFGSIFVQINISRTVMAITVACIPIYYLDKALPMACNRQSSSRVRILLLHSLTHSLTHSLIHSFNPSLNWIA